MIRPKSVDREPAVLPAEHVGGGRGVEQASEPEPADHAAADPLGERDQVCGGDWPGRQERRRGVTPCMVSSRHEDAVGHAGVQVHVVVERRAEAVEEGDAAVPRAGSTRWVGIRIYSSPGSGGSGPPGVGGPVFMTYGGINSQTWGANSFHPGIVQIALADGSVRTASETLDWTLWNLICSGKDGEVTSEW